MVEIHETAIVDKQAVLGENVKIGPYAIIEGDVEIGDGTVIGPHACVYDGARIGKNVKIFQAASVSNAPQDLKYDNEKTKFYIGDNTTIRECVTLHRGTEELGYSKVGANCLLMAYAHVAHDCLIGDNNIIANSVQIGGHAVFGDWVIVGGASAVHQFVKIGDHAMIGGGFRCTVDVPPFVTGSGVPIRYSGPNSIGLRRRGFSNDAIMNIKKAFQILFRSGYNRTDALAKLEAEFAGDANVAYIIDFMKNIKRNGFR